MPQILQAGTSEAQSGYTLIELLVVMTIFVLVAGLLPVAYGRVVPSARLNNAASAIMTDLNKLRMHAYSTGERPEFWLDEKNRSYSVDQGKSWELLAQNVEVVLLAERSVIGDQFPYIRYYESGGSTGGQLVLSIAQNKRTISIDWLTGKAEMSRE